MRVWGKLISKGKIKKDKLIELIGPADDIATEGSLDELYKALDIPRPIWLSSHERDFKNFARAVFLPGDFIESVAFEKFELEAVSDRPSGKRDPRNDFSD